MNWGKFHVNVNNEVMNCLWLCACVYTCVCVSSLLDRGFCTLSYYLCKIYSKVSLLQKLCKLQETLFLESLLDNRSALPEDLPISLSISLIRDVYTYTYSSLHTPTPGCNATIEHPEPKTCYLPCLSVNHRQDQLVAQSVMVVMVAVVMTGECWFKQYRWLWWWLQRRWRW